MTRFTMREFKALVAGALVLAFIIPAELHTATLPRDAKGCLHTAWVAFIARVPSSWGRTPCGNEGGS